MSLESSAALAPGLRDAWGKPYIPAVGTRLKFILAFIFVAVAALGATGAYLSSIRWLDYFSGKTYTTPFKYWMLLAHIALGLIALIPFLAFGVLHWSSARHRPNRRAVKLGTLLFFTGIVVCATGVGLIRVEGMPQVRTETTGHSIVLWLHILLPLLAVALYIAHRRAGPDIQWRWGYAWGGCVGVFVVAMLIMHSMDPNSWFKQGSVEGRFYFKPSDALTADGNFIPPEAMMMDEYCMKCHQDIYKDHLHSSHKFSSFSNPAYLFSVRETREVGKQRDGNVKASRWCAGCHDPIPFFGGVFEDPRTDPKYDAERDKLRLERYLEVEDVIAGKKPAADSKVSSAGVSCVVCHSMTHVNSQLGNGAYTIEESRHYPFAFSKNTFFQWINNQLIKSEPSFHKKTFLKPFHKTAEFCSTCHKVSLPVELNYYKEFLRGQNHYDTYLLSGVSGVGVRILLLSAQGENQLCPVPHADEGEPRLRRPRFRCGWQIESSQPWLPRRQHRPVRLAAARPEIRIDPPGARQGGSGARRLPARHRPRRQRQEGSHRSLWRQGRRGDRRQTDRVATGIAGVETGPDLSRGSRGAHDRHRPSVHARARLTPTRSGSISRPRAAARTIAHNGATANPDDTGEVDRWAHYINVLMLDRNGNRINRRNPQDIFTPLYNHQIPPGAASTLHYRLDVPADVTGPIELKARVALSQIRPGVHGAGV